MKRYFFIAPFLLVLINFAMAQDSCNLRISLLTCSSGNEMYSTWGHTAIRVNDLASGDDYIFNYGTFEFTPDFNKKFIKGNLFYSLSVEHFNDFINEYRAESRSVKEQELLISCQEKQRLYDALQINAEGKNRFYLYNFLYDNCTTRARDIIVNSMNNTVVFQPVLPQPVPTFRNLIHIYLNKEKEYWSKLGIDILLGARLDKKPTNMQAMFLPDYLLKGFEGATIRNLPFTGKAITILPMPENIPSVMPLLTPVAVFSIVFIILFILSIARNATIKKALVIFDFVFFLLLGAAGVLLLYMWFGTEHRECRDNYNLLWALPFNLIMAFFVHRNNNLARNYFIIVCGICILLLLTWLFLPQQMNIALVPLLLLIILRSWHLSNRTYAGKENKI